MLQTHRNHFSMGLAEGATDEIGTLQGQAQSQAVHRARASGTLCMIPECSAELPVNQINLASALTPCHGSGSLTHS